MYLTIVVLYIVSIALPLMFAWQIWRLDEPSRVSWLGSVAEKLAFVVLILLVGRWDIVGMSTRIALAAILAIAVGTSLRRHAKRPWRARRRSALRRLTGTVPLMIYLALLAYVAIGMMRNTAAYDVSFPLRGGSFVVAQGGGNPLLTDARRGAKHSGRQEGPVELTVAVYLISEIDQYILQPGYVGTTRSCRRHHATRLHGRHPRRWRTKPRRLGKPCLGRTAH